MAIICGMGMMSGLSAHAQESTPTHTPPEKTSEAFRSTELPLPRFASTGSNQVYVRAGPGQRYPVQWVYKKEGIPVEIILEYDIWRKIRDFDGQEGWVHHTLLSGKRTAFVVAGENISIHKMPEEQSLVQAILAPKAAVRVEKCAQSWCLVNVSGYKGWILQNRLWGVYGAENFD